MSARYCNRFLSLIGITDNMGHIGSCLLTYCSVSLSNLMVLLTLGPPLTVGGSTDVLAVEGAAGVVEGLGDVVE